MKIPLPLIPPTLQPVNDVRQLLELDETISRVWIRDAVIEGANAAAFSATEARIDRLEAPEVNFRRSNLLDVRAAHCTLSGAVFAESSWRRVAVYMSRCSGVQLQNSMLKDVTFNQCKLDLANFRFAKLRNVQFVECVLQEVDFYASTLDHVTFEHCQLQRAEFSGASLSSTDLRSSDLTNIKGVEYLKGAIIDSAQLMAIASLLASGLHITVQDD